MSITSLAEISDSCICKNCRNFIYEEKNEYKSNKKKDIFGIGNLLPATEDALDIFKILATLYLGGASIVELKKIKDGYKEETKCMGLVEKSVETKTIKLGPDQNDILMAGLGLHQSHAVIAPWGGGKSMLLQLELNRVIENHVKSKEPVNIFLVVYEMKATDLLKYYKEYVKRLEKIELIKITVMNLKEICEHYSVSLENR